MADYPHQRPDGQRAQGDAVDRAGEFDERVAEAYHGAIDASEMRRRGIDPQHVLDFSTNVNPFGPSPRVRQAVCDCALDRYPDRECLQLRETISAHEQVAIERIIAGNGSSELLQSLAQLFLQPGDEVLILGPTYGEYARAACLAGARVKSCRATADSEFAVPAEAFEAALRCRPKLAFLCNPNNPTGQLIKRKRILGWVQDYPETRFIVDESYIDFADTDSAEPTAAILTADLPNLIVLRSLTKSHALAGLRLGYAVAAPDVIEQLRQRRIPWSVSAPAQAAGVAAINDQAYLNRCLARLRDAKDELLRGLGSRQFHPVASAANFFLLPLSGAAAVRERLLCQNLLVRDCASFGLPNHIRIGVRSGPENAQLIRALSEL